MRFSDCMYNNLVGGKCTPFLIFVITEMGWNIFFPKHRPSGPMLSISRNVHVHVRVCVRLFTFEVPFKRPFAPTSRSRMSNRDLKSLGKSNGKKWSQISTFLFGSGLKSPQKKFFFADFAAQNMLKTTLPDGWETSDVPFSCNFFCVVGLVQSVPHPWTGAISISISSRALKTMICSGVW